MVFNMNELVVKTQEDLMQYSVLTMESAELAEVMTENLGGQNLSPSDLMKIKVPSGGGIMWELPSLSGAPLDKAEFEGIIIFHKFQNAYWEGEYDGSNNPPDCAAPDSMVGIGNPGGTCANCPLNQYGSAIKGKGKACKNTKILFILMEGAMLPMALNVPPTSLKAVKNYLLGLSSAGVPYFGAVTSFTLIKDKNESGIQYSKVNLKLKDKVDKATKDKLKAYQMSIRPALETIQIDADFTSSQVD